MKAKKVNYIIVGVICLVVAIPILLVILGVAGGAVYYMTGAK